MARAGGLVAVGHQLEAAMGGLDVAFDDTAYERFVRAAVMDQVGDRADLEAVLRGEHDEVRQPRHRAVVIEDLADHRSRREARERCEVAARLGMPCAHQHAAGLGGDREDMAGLDDVGGLRVFCDRDLHRARAVVRRDAGSHALGGLDRRGEVGAHRGAVVAHHGLDAELPATLAGQREADEAACMAHHEVDGLRRHVLRGDDDVALVLAVLLVDKHDHAAGFHLGDDLGDWTDGCGFTPHGDPAGRAPDYTFATKQNGAPGRPVRTAVTGYQSAFGSAAAGAATGAAGARISPAASACARPPSFSLIRADLPERWRR